MPLGSGPSLDPVVESEGSAAPWQERFSQLDSHHRNLKEREHKKLDIQTNLNGDFALQELSMLPSPQLNSGDVFESFAGSMSSGAPVMRAPSTSRRWPVTPAARLLHFHAGNLSPRENTHLKTLGDSGPQALRPGLGQRKSSYSSSVAEARTPGSHHGALGSSPRSPGYLESLSPQRLFDEHSDNEMEYSPEPVHLSIPRQRRYSRGKRQDQPGDISDLSLGPSIAPSGNVPTINNTLAGSALAANVGGSPMARLPTQPFLAGAQLNRATSTTLHREVRRHLLADSPASEPVGGSFSNLKISPEFAEAINRKFADKEDVYVAFDSNLRKGTWDRIRMLGKGSFSKVILATPALSHVKLDRLEDAAHVVVAVKITELGVPKSTQRLQLEEALRRDVDLAKRMSHPSLISLIAFNIDSERALMVMPYCQGGDMFELVSQHRKNLPVMLVQRLFADIVNAVAYLHSNHVAHRDIKLENILISLPHSELLALQHPETWPRSLAVLTDLGLARDFDPANPMLTNRCGSEDYVPPELLLGQPYDGRESDSWALGVLLYATLEGRLPFDAPPNTRPEGNRARMRTVTRIARVDWRWYKRKDAGPEWDFIKSVVTSCLRKRDDNRALATELVELPELQHSKPKEVEFCWDASDHMELFRDE